MSAFGTLKALISYFACAKLVLLMQSGILAFEGAPGVGKSTLAAHFASCGIPVIAEANLLFSRPNPEPPTWYLERQCERWQRATQSPTTILDGDPFQPLWFNWAFPEATAQSLSFVIDFYRETITQNRIAFPHRYVFLTLPESLRAERMLQRELARNLGEDRARQKTARYAKLVEPQSRYFHALANHFPHWVQILDATFKEQTLQAIESFTNPNPPPPPLEVLHFAAHWLTQASIPS